MAPPDDIIPLAVVAGLAGLCVAWVGWIVFYSPEADQLRIKSDYAGPAHKVLSIKRSGFWPGGRSSPWYRLYKVTTQDVIDGRTTIVTVGVEVTLFSYAGLRVFGRPSSTGL